MNNYNMTIEFKPCNKQDPYLQWEHIAIWYFKFTIELLTREANRTTGRNIIAKVP